MDCSGTGEQWLFAPKVTLQEAENFVPEAGYHGSGLRTEILEINHLTTWLERGSASLFLNHTGHKKVSVTILLSRSIFLKKTPAIKSGLSHISLVKKMCEKGVGFSIPL